MRPKRIRGSRGEATRGNSIGRAVWLVDWLGGRRLPFATADLAAAMEASTRTAQRWLEAAEAVGLVDCDRTRRGWRWTKGEENG